MTFRNRSITCLNKYTVKTLPEFDAWLDGLKDRTTRLRLSRRLDKLQRGNLGDIKPVGSGVYEMREYFGLGGGDKGSQEADIAKAKQRKTMLED